MSEGAEIAVIVVVIIGGAIVVAGAIAFISRRLNPQRKKRQTNNKFDSGNAAANYYVGDFGRDIDEISAYSNRSRSTVAFKVDSKGAPAL